MSPPFRYYALRFTSLLLSLPLFALGSGCVLNLTIGDPDGMGGSGGATSTPPPPDFSGAGQGETCPAGTPSAGSSGTGGGSGGCMGPDGTGQNAEICDTMEITPSSVGGPAASNCDVCGGSNGAFPPLGYTVCLRGFIIFRAAYAEALQACLNLINGAPAYACAIGPVADCMTRMYSEACPSQAAADTCQLIRDTLCVMNEPFDVTACAEGLKPFNDDALQRMASCIAYSGEPDCLMAYTACFHEVTGY